MRGSPISNPIMRLVPALLGGAGAAVLLAAPVLAADPAPQASIGPPTPLFSPSPQATSPASAPRPMPSSALAAPAKHPAAPLQRLPPDAKPLIPPAAVSIKLGPPPDPRSALSLETDLEPLGPAEAVPSQPGPPGATAAPTAKSPSS